MFVIYFVLTVALCFVVIRAETTIGSMICGEGTLHAWMFTVQFYFVVRCLLYLARGLNLRHTGKDSLILDIAVILIDVMYAV